MTRLYPYPPLLASARTAFGAILLVAVQACALFQERECKDSEMPAVTETLYFGTARPGGTVTPEEWTAFVNEVVTPRFLQGLTTWAAAGQWRMASGAIEHERSHILQLTHDGTPAKDLAVRAIMERYKKEFQQEAVLRVRSRSCVSY